MAGYYRNTAGLDEACPSRQRGEGPRVACTSEWIKFTVVLYCEDECGILWASTARAVLYGRIVRMIS